MTSETQQECRDCGKPFPYSADADRCPACASVCGEGEWDACTRDPELQAAIDALPVTTRRYTYPVQP